MGLVSLKERFNNGAKFGMDFGLNRNVLLCTLIAGAMIAPFSASYAITVATAPLFYLGLGIAFKGAAKGLEAFTRQRPSGDQAFSAPPVTSLGATPK